MKKDAKQAAKKAVKPAKEGATQGAALTKPAQPKPSVPRRRLRLKLTLPLVLAVIALGSAVAVAAIGQKPGRSAEAWTPTPAHSVTPAELAQWIVEGRRDFVVVDLRPSSAFQAGHVRGAVSCGSCHANRAEGQASQRGESFVDLSKKIVVYTASGTEPVVLPRSMVRSERLIALAGGYDAWAADILAPVRLDGITDPDELGRKRKAEALRAYFSGERADSAAAAALPIAPIRRDNAHTPARAREGC